jgi:hypothetical protein
MIAMDSTDSKIAASRNAAGVGTLADEGNPGGVRWLGWTDPEVERSAGPPAILGSAHGPRLLELLRAAC